MAVFGQPQPADQPGRPGTVPVAVDDRLSGLIVPVAWRNRSHQQHIVVEIDEPFAQSRDAPQHRLDREAVEGRQQVFVVAENRPVVHHRDRNVTFREEAGRKSIRMGILRVGHDIDMVHERSKAQDGGDAEVDLAYRAESGGCSYLRKGLTPAVSQEFSSFGFVYRVFSIDPGNHDINRFHIVNSSKSRYRCGVPSSRQTAAGRPQGPVPAN